jgi:hypothetical protein
VILQSIPVQDKQVYNPQKAKCYDDNRNPSEQIVKSVVAMHFYLKIAGSIESRSQRADFHDCGCSALDFDAGRSIRFTDVVAHSNEIVSMLIDKI